MPKLSQYSIVIEKDASYSSLAAAKFLANNISAATGYQIPVYTDDLPAKDFEIVVGQTNREELAGICFERSEAREYEYEIRFVGTRLFMSGLGKVGEKIARPFNSYVSFSDGAIGTSLAVYRFVEETFGAGFLFPADLSLITDMDADKIEIDGRYDFKYTREDLYGKRPEIADGAVMYSIPVIGSHRRFGNSAIFKASDGSFAVYNGGLEADAEHICDLLEYLNADKTQKPRVSAWLISLPMFGYSGALKAICEDEALKERISVDKVYYKVLSENFHTKGSANARAEHGEYRNALLFAGESLGCEMLEVNTGDVIKVGDIEFEVLYSPTEETESAPRVHYFDASVVYKAKFADMSVVLFGNARKRVSDYILGNGPEKFDCDVLVLSNHGKGGIARECYERIKAKKYMYQCCPAQYYGDNGEGFASDGGSITRTRNYLSELGISCGDICKDTYGIVTFGNK